jgi:hypothetical protein
MRLGLFMTLAAVAALVFGLAFLVAPTNLLALYGITLDAPGQFVARYLGSAFLGIAAVTWLSRALTSGPGLRAILVADFVVSITGLAVAIFDRLYGPGNMLVWSTVVIYLLLSAGFGYFVFVKPPAS